MTKNIYFKYAKRQAGHCSPNLANSHPGKLSHARWLTKTNRLLRLYVSSERSSTNLKNPAEFVLKVYLPLWFYIKTHWSCKNGAQHTFRTIERFEESRRPCHSKKLILPSSRKPPSQRAVWWSPFCKRVGFKANSEGKKKPSYPYKTVRYSKCKFWCAEYTELINWAEIEVTSPPVLSNVTGESLQTFNRTFCNTRFPCHIQVVERCVNLVTKASIAVIG